MRDYISYSQLNMLLRCGIQYENRYIKGLKVPPSASLVRGKCGHKVAETNFKQKIESRVDIPSEQALDIFSSEWDESSKEIVFSDDELAGDSPDTAIGKWKDSGVGMVGVFHKGISPTIQPLSVEENITIVLKRPDESTETVKAVIDCVSEWGDGTNLAIDEFKFVSKSPAKNDIDTDIQMTMYDLAFRHHYHGTSLMLRKHWAISTKTPKTATQECPPRPIEQIERLYFRIDAALRALRGGAFLPAQNGSFWCSQKLCGYFQNCKYRP